MAQPFYSSIDKTREQFRRKEISPVELIAAHLDRIAQIKPRLNPFVNIDAESARARTRECESRITRGETLRPLEAITLSVISCLDVAGLPCPSWSLVRQAYFTT